MSSAHGFLDDVLLPTSSSNTWWYRMVLIKVNVLAWRFSLDKLPTRVNLDRRGLDIPSLCCLVCDSVRRVLVIFFSRVGLLQRSKFRYVVGGALMCRVFSPSQVYLVSRSKAFWEFEVLVGRHFLLFLVAYMEFS